MAPSKHRRPARSAPGARPSTSPPGDGSPYASGLAPGTQSITACLAVANIGASVEFLERVMGFTRGVTLSDGDGRLRYAELTHNGSVVMLVRQGDVASPSGGAPALYTYVPDVDRAVATAREQGAATGEIQDRPWGDRVGTVTDPDGYRWLLATFRKLASFDA